MSSLIVTETELRRSLPLGPDALAAVEQAFTWLAEGRVTMPPVLHIDVDPQSAVDVKGAFVDGLDHLAVKIASGFFDNPSIGLPSGSSVIVLVSAKTGLYDAVFLDNGYLMDLRTGLAGAVAAKHLAPPEVETAAVIGTGVQARYQMESLALVRRFKRVLVYGRNADRVAAYCTEMRDRLGVTVEPAESIEAAVQAAQVVVTTTQATTPLIQADWLHPGLQITAMGSDLPGKQELASEVLQRADLLVCDSVAQCRIGGELQHLAAWDSDNAVMELGEITSGQQPVVRDESMITVCDLTGTGVQDTAIAVEALRRVSSAGSGTQIG